MSVESIIENVKAAYPDDSILVYQFKSGGTGSFSGQKLLAVHLDDGYYLQVFKLLKSSGVYMNEDEIKFKAFPFVYDTKHITDDEQRRDILQNKLKSMFPDHNVNVFIFDGSDWDRQSNHTKGTTYFSESYGSEVDVVLS